MNIFYLDYDLTKCAQAHGDKHVVKMILEHAQLLSSVHHILDSDRVSDYSAYGLTHKNHPSAIWARESLENYMWLYALTEELHIEYQYRYGSHKVHKSWEVIKNLPFPFFMENIGITPFRKAIADERIKAIEDPVEAYREYYRVHKRDLAVWTGRKQPEWWR